MDLITIIEKNIELKIRRDNLTTIIDREKRSENYAKTGGNIAFYENNYDRESAYNSSARTARDNQNVASSEVSQVEQLLELTERSYNENLSVMNTDQINETANTLSIIRRGLERRMEELSRRRAWAREEGDKAFASHDFQGEQEYNRISSECYMEIARLKAHIDYYASFENDLTLRSSKNDGHDYDGYGGYGK